MQIEEVKTSETDQYIKIVRGRYVCDECGHAYDGDAQCSHNHEDSKGDYKDLRQSFPLKLTPEFNFSNEAMDVFHETALETLKNHQ